MPDTAHPAVDPRLGPLVERRTYAAITREELVTMFGPAVAVTVVKSDLTLKK